MLMEQDDAAPPTSAALPAVRRGPLPAAALNKAAYATSDFWAPLAGGICQVGPVARHCFQRGSPSRCAHVGAYVIASVTSRGNGAEQAAGGGAGASADASSGGAAAAAAATDYVVALAIGYDAAAQTYDLLHTPNHADHAVLKAQRQDATPNVDPDCPLRPRVFHRVPAKRVAPYPGGTLSAQYFKGQEVLARWEAAATVVEPSPASDDRFGAMRPRTTAALTAWTTLLYPAEIVGGGLYDVQVRFLHGSDPDAVHTIHKLDVTVPPEVGEPDKAEKKRQRKARERRNEEREARLKREAKLAAAGTPVVARSRRCPRRPPWRRDRRVLWSRRRARLRRSQSHRGRARPRRRPARGSTQPPPPLPPGRAAAAAHAAGDAPRHAACEAAAARRRAAAAAHGAARSGRGRMRGHRRRRPPTPVARCLRTCAQREAPPAAPGAAAAAAGAAGRPPPSSRSAAAAPATDGAAPRRPSSPPDQPGTVRCLGRFSIPPEAEDATPPAALAPDEAANEIEGWRAMLGLAPRRVASNPRPPAQGDATQGRAGGAVAVPCSQATEMSSNRPRIVMAAPRRAARNAPRHTASSSASMSAARVKLES